MITGYTFRANIEIRAKSYGSSSEHSRGRDQLFLGRGKMDLIDYNTFELSLEG